MDEPSAEELPFILQGKYFQVVKRDGLKITAKCKSCPIQKGTEIKGSVNATTNFLTHLKRVHTAEVESYEKDKVDYNDYAKKRKIQLPRRSPSTPQISTLFPSNSKSISTQEKLLADFVVKGMHPYSIVEEDGFRNYVKNLNPDAKLMSRHTLVKRIGNRFDFMRSCIIKKVGDAKYLCITTDGWSCDGNSRSFLGVTVHWIDCKLNRQSAALACRRFKGTHSFDRIADLLLTILGDYKIQVPKIVKGVTDSGTNFLKAFSEFGLPAEPGNNQDDPTDEELFEEMEHERYDFIQLSPLLNHGNLEEDLPSVVLPPHHPCSSHKLNLICSVDIVKSKKAPKLQQSSFAKCMGIWNKQSRSPKVAEKIHDLCGKFLKTPVPTRWNSFYDSMSALLKQEDKFGDICKLVNVPDFKSTEIEFMKQYLSCVKPIACGLDRLQGECGTFYGELIPTLLYIENELVGLLETKPTHCEYLPKLLLESLRSRFEKFLNLSIEHEDAILAAVSHPFFKLRWVPKDKMEFVRSIFVKTLCTQHDIREQSVQSQPTDKPPSSTVGCEFFGYGGFEDSPEQENTVEMKIKEECNAYFRSVDVQIPMLHNFPNVMSAFVRYNTPLPSSAPVERLFNYSKMVLSPKRRRLTDKNFEMTTLLKVNNY